MGVCLSMGEEAQTDDGASKMQESEHRGGVLVISDGELAKPDDAPLGTFHYFSGDDPGVRLTPRPAVRSGA